MPFKNGNKLGKGRPVGGVSKLPAEAKDVLARAYTELGGLKGFIDWCLYEVCCLSHRCVVRGIKLIRI